MSDSVLLAEFARRHEATPPVRDRLMTTMFLVGALHAVVILGVSFAAPGLGGATDAPSLEVLLVRDPVAEERVNTRADYLAQVNQRGAGTAEDVRGAESPHSLPAEPAEEGRENSAGATGADAGDSGDSDLLASRAASSDKRFFAHGAPAAPRGTPLVLEPLSPEASGADTGDDLRLRGKTERELLVTANTRESSVAVYLYGWRRKIERVGTLNYPLEAVRQAGLTGSPVLEVQLLADGRLGGAWIKRSSGHPELDQASLEILRLAAPFEPFPRALAARHDALRLVYEWQFLGGEVKDSSVRVPADTR
ncbi:MAG TPA: TonB family protein [Steroidobacteraceae bacterium]|nr:TonB family protein [Steroidobacteraceae bacterium]